jgi:hypothetical protein
MEETRSTAAPKAIALSAIARSSSLVRYRSILVSSRDLQVMQRSSRVFLDQQ